MLVLSCSALGKKSSPDRSRVLDKLKNLTLKVVCKAQVVTLQRGPVPPVAQEIEAPASEGARRLGVALLVLPLLVLLPFPWPVAPDAL